jgi:LytR cell envelope-related transcriptional attenuator
MQVRPGADRGDTGRRPTSLLGGGLPPERSSSFARKVLPVLIGVVAIAAVVIALLVLTGGTNGKHASTASVGASNAPVARHRAKPAAAAFKPSSVTVAVLNGTATSGLAHRVSLKLTNHGYKQGTIATATDQTRTATVVAYLPGHKQDAMAVASSLKLGAGSVQPIDSSTRAVACPPPAACTATVVVTVGSDLANTQ